MRVVRESKVSGELSQRSLTVRDSIERDPNANTVPVLRNRGARGVREDSAEVMRRNRDGSSELEEPDPRP
jgi:hypothetical protein